MTDIRCNPFQSCRKCLLCFCFLHPPHRVNVICRQRCWSAFVRLRAVVAWPSRTISLRCSRVTYRHTARCTFTPSCLRLSLSCSNSSLVSGQRATISFRDRFSLSNIFYKIYLPLMGNVFVWDCHISPKGKLVEYWIFCNFSPDLNRHTSSSAWPAEGCFAKLV